jgi:hypothetical protein
MSDHTEEEEEEIEKNALFFTAMGLDTQRAYESARNWRLRPRLRILMEESGGIERSRTSASIANLLYVLADEISEHVWRRRGKLVYVVARMIGNQRIKTKEQLLRVICHIKHCKDMTTTYEDEIADACGLNVPIEVIEAKVRKAILSLPRTASIRETMQLLSEDKDLESANVSIVREILGELRLEILTTSAGTS